MRHAPCLVVCAVVAVAAGPSLAQESSPGVISEPAPLAPGDPGWYGVEWVTDSVGQVLPEVQVTSPAKQADQWLVVNAFGHGVEQSWSYGPYSAEGAVFTVPIVLDAQVNAPGLVRITIRLDLLDPATGDLMASRRTRPVYVDDAGLASELWLDEQTAEATVVRNLAFDVPPDVHIEGLVGFEVTR